MRKGDFVYNNDSCGLLGKERARLGMSQSSFANYIGINKRTLQDIEYGRSNVKNMKAETLYNVAQRIGCRMEDLLELDDLERKENMKKEQ